MSTTKISIPQTLYSLLFVTSVAACCLLLAACCLIGSHLLVWIAPWRETEIYLVTMLAFVSGVGIWQLGRRKPLIRLSLFVATVLLTAGLIFSHYQAFIAHYQKESPSIYEHVNEVARLSRTHNLK